MAAAAAGLGRWGAGEISVANVDPSWSLEALLADYHPHEGWRAWFSESYTKAMESSQFGVRLDGWKKAAIIFGDMHVPVLCLFVCHHGRSLVPGDKAAFLGHIDLCLWELGLAIPSKPDKMGGVPSRDVGKPEAFRRDIEMEREWFAEQLRPFDGNVGKAAVFAMGLTAGRFGMLRGPAEPSIAQVLDESQWVRAR
jgi:hypothetical protein